MHKRLNASRLFLFLPAHFIFDAMKRGIWFGGLALLLAGPLQAQSLTGIWQGVEGETGEPDSYWPTVLRLQQGKKGDAHGVLYQEVGGNPRVTATFEVQGQRTGAVLRLTHGPKLDETGRIPFKHWCEGGITFTYDANQEKLTGKAAYRPVGDCDVGTFTLYRVRLKSAAAVPAGVETTLRVSGRNVLWYADADLKQPVNTGNSYRTRLSKTTTFYIAQGYYPSSQSTAVPVTIRATGTPPIPPVAPRPPRDTAQPVPAPPLSTTPAVLPTVLFRVGTPELLPQSEPALNQLAAELKSRPTLQLRVSGHADKVGEPEKNQVLSEQRAEAVKSYLVKAGIAPERISTVGYGDTRPLYPSPDVRNRRVEVAEVK
jgi:outer membrane protein OmpA-like peptidoglycan-associated protein